MVFVCIGTKNVSKITGIERAFSSFYEEVQLLAIDLSYKLPPQPIGIKEIMSGAEKRAKEAIKSSEMCEFGVGVEAGLIKIEESYYDIQASFVINKDGRGYFGFSPSFIIPKSFSEGIITKKYRELEEVTDAYFNTENVGEKGGVIKLLTKGRVTREDLTYYAVMMSLIPFQNSNLYF
ncbi:inosine/xanthosine triphosphatase [Fervidicoccus fontis]|jgi:inosine/xanthosine triphosphatase|uniref:Probable inosine/xanthosine triphosphatase n=2 Tax=Fervidicoccus fontis TaxID=683846 RepID=I0A1N9_FERFK|nr:inosine/xanthosine triphosphatase [Fervidicoccus fontis]AFH42896.1 NTPase [Fervidicoccus fontis Kam940]MBE9391547.1 inosine/xanthosine triphosphatase [Fervidicoccus fontis]PMB76366.1 MAG: inosine/xanthosine triphosphatase [Fervidicoccus fontis]HEW63613.1 inosine/xanthosine triphosphatase [Fervidicoccus fontis]